ncbi:hypothetical protein R3D73_005006 [Serratia marcescens]|nr:hypothetical protein [Serratia marcescens]ELQ9442108.1 hypothetical protein [Serratia marcescens]ELT5562898.1 hypothetical protein [Serratia marcescens]
METKKGMRELTRKELEQVSGGIGVEWHAGKGKAWVKPFMGKKVGKG